VTQKTKRISEQTPIWMIAQRFSHSLGHKQTLATQKETRRSGFLVFVF